MLGTIVGWVSFLSTPSARRATRCWTPSASDRTYFYPRPPRGGRPTSSAATPMHAYFYPRPPRGGRPASGSSRLRGANFYPRPPRGGRRPTFWPRSRPRRFLSTPSARRATKKEDNKTMTLEISIHALREEGDQSAKDKRSKSWEFLSTPSARRATSAARSGLPRVLYFYPRPPRGGRPEYLGDLRVIKEISIHALREEGDVQVFQPKSSKKVFLSTPSARRATNCASVYSAKEFEFLSTPSARRATLRPLLRGRRRMDFYPRPPRGGRHHFFFGPVQHLAISIHALREEGDASCPMLLQSTL